MPLSSTNFGETFGGLVLGASLVAMLVSFRLLGDRFPRFSAASLISLALGLLFASHWLLVKSPRDNLEQLLTMPMGAITLIAALACSVWGYHKLRSAMTGEPVSLRTRPNCESNLTQIGRVKRTFSRLPIIVWLAALAVGSLFTAGMLYKPLISGIWNTKRVLCRIPQDLGCTSALVGLSLAVGFLAGLLVIFVCSRVLGWIREHKR